MLDRAVFCQQHARFLEEAEGSSNASGGRFFRLRPLWIRSEGASVTGKTEGRAITERTVHLDRSAHQYD